MSKYQILLKIWARVHKRRKIQLSLLIFLMLLSGIAEMISVFSIIPFLLTYFSINYNLNDNFLKFVIYVIFYVICYLILFRSVNNVNSNL